MIVILTNSVIVELEELKSDVAELNTILNTAIRQKAKEVLSTEISILSSKIASLKDLLEEKTENETKWTEVVAG
jgi:hypothetical protein